MKKTNTKIHPLLLIFLILFYVPIFIFSVILIVSNGAKDKIEMRSQKRNWLKNNQEKYFIFYTEKRFWGDFLRRTVLPGIPDKFEPFQINRERQLFNSILRQETRNTSWEYNRPPYLGYVKKNGIVYTSLHDELYDYKINKRDVPSNLMNKLLESFEEKVKPD